MTLSSQYSSEQMYNEWIRGTPISEMVRKTGIKRKTWNKRFEQYEKQLEMETNNSPKIINGDNDDKPQIIARNVANNIDNHNRTNKFLAALAVLGFMIAVYFIYMEIKKE